MPLQTLSKWIKRLRNRHFLAIDIFIFFITPYIALILRFDGSVEWQKYENAMMLSFILFSSIKLSIFYYYNFYKRLWRMASIDELAFAIFISMIIFIIEFFSFNVLKKVGIYPFSMIPPSLPLLDAILSMIFVISLRFSIRFIERANQRIYSKRTKKQRVLIAGAGEAGFSIALEMQRSPHLGLNPIAFVDDDKSKHGLKLRGIPIKGNCNNISMISRELKINKVIIAMPLASGDKIRQIMSNCEADGIETMTVPGIFEILNGKVSINKIRKIQIEDLLRREPVKTDINQVKQLIKGKKILITGAGGSIGSELCRQVLKCYPSEMILIGHGENSIFDIEQELKERKKEIQNIGKNTTKIISRIADLRFKERLRSIFSETEPEIIFHAAAHKHVPLMEWNPQEAVTNNILGTKNLVDIAIEFGVNHFISISTDKAVNPTNIMGASKRITEMIILDAARRTGKVYSAVRFGNVLGSRGSVVKTFQRQLQNGGPITITHPEIIRFFMTIPEAVQLVLQAAVLGKGGEIFVLDMGQPVRIMDLAKDVIRLAGLREGSDIDIKITGLRPGEKLYEELFVKGEQYDRTIHEKILIAHNASACISDILQETLDYFEETNGQLNRDEILGKLCNLIPEFNPDQKEKSYIINGRELQINSYDMLK